MIVLPTTQKKYATRFVQAIAGILILFLSSNSLLASCTGNLLGNAGFEASDISFFDWDVSGTGTLQITSDAYEGNNAALLGGQPYVKLQQQFTATEGDEFTFTAQIKASQSNYYIRIRFLNAAQNIIATHLSSPNATGQYELHTITGVAPVNTTAVLVSILKTATEGNVTVDDFCLTGGTVSPCNPDVEAPVISNCPTDLNLTTTGTTAIGNWIAPTATDACDDNPVLSSNLPSGYVFSLGTTTVTYTTTDNVGNASQCSFNVTVSSSIPQGCVSNEIPNGSFEGGPTPVSNWDIIGPATFNIVNDSYIGNNAMQISGAPYGKLEQTVTGVTAGDEITLSAQVKADQSNFYLRIKYLNAAAQVTTTFSAESIATGNYEEHLLVTVAPPNAVSAIISFLKTGQDGVVIVDDFCFITTDGVDSCNPDVTPPVFESCPADIVVNTSDNSIAVNWDVPDVTDNCSFASLISNFNPGDVFNLGTTQVNYNSSDAIGNESSCTFSVTVNQTTPPIGCENNLLDNAGFEQSNTGIPMNWTVSGLSSNVGISDDAYAGNNAALIGGTTYTKLQQNIAVSPGDELLLSAQVKAITNNFLIRLRFFNASGNSLSTFQGNEPATGQYQENTLMGIAPANSAYVTVSLVKLANLGDVLVDDFCLQSNGEDLVDLSMANFNLTGNLEVGKGSSLQFDAINSGAEEIVEPFLFYANAYLSEDNVIDNNDVLIGALELGSLLPSANLIDLTLYIPEDVVPNQSYYIIVSLDRYDVIDESNEENNTYIFNEIVGENTGLACTTDELEAGEIVCVDYYDNGNLKIITTSSTEIFEHEVDATGQVISSEYVSPSEALTEHFFYVENDKLIEGDATGNVFGEVDLPQELLEFYYYEDDNQQFEKVIAFDGGYIFTGYLYEGGDYPNEADKGLTIVKTDANLNIVDFVTFETPGNYNAFVHSLAKITEDRFAVIYSEGDNYLSDRDAFLLIMDPNLDVQTSRGVASNSTQQIILRKTLCGFWTYSTKTSSGGGGGGFSFYSSESKTYYEFQNDDFIPFKSFNRATNNSGFGGTYTITQGDNFYGPASDGTELTAERRTVYGNTLPPYGYIPSTDTVFFEHNANGSLIWSTEKVPYAQYSFDELVEIGGHYFLISEVQPVSNNTLPKVLITSLDCDENDPPITGEPNCEASSDFPWHEWISSVTTNTFSNASGKSIYSDFTDEGEIEASVGQMMILTVAATFSYFTADEYVSVWIDYNQNDIFEDNERYNEIILAPENGNFATGLVNFFIEIPEEAIPGSTKMRIVMQRGSFANACGSIPFGEVEDYTVNINTAFGNSIQRNNEIEPELTVFPNPAHEVVFIDLGDFLSESMEIEVVNNYGTSVYKKDLSAVVSRFEKIDLTEWKNGLYLVWVKPANKKRHAIRLVVARTY